MFGLFSCGWASDYGHHLRSILAEELLYFGHGTFEQQLDWAYKHFCSYCYTWRIKHSQTPFTKKLVSCQCCNIFFMFLLWSLVEATVELLVDVKHSILARSARRMVNTSWLPKPSMDALSHRGCVIAWRMQCSAGAFQTMNDCMWHRWQWT